MFQGKIAPIFAVCIVCQFMANLKETLIRPSQLIVSNELLKKLSYGRRKDRGMLNE